jgi:ATP-dependent Clp protease ATP-binding subunit ClpB
MGYLPGSQGAKSLSDDYVSTEHLLIAIAEEKGAMRKVCVRTESIARREKVIKEMRGGTRITVKCGRELSGARNIRATTELAARLDPVIGRDDEVRRVIRVLSRRTEQPGTYW